MVMAILLTFLIPLESVATYDEPTNIGTITLYPNSNMAYPIYELDEADWHLGEFAIESVGLPDGLELKAYSYFIRVVGDGNLLGTYTVKFLYNDEWYEVTLKWVPRGPVVPSADIDDGDEVCLHDGGTFSLVIPNDEGYEIRTTCALCGELLDDVFYDNQGAIIVPSCDHMNTRLETVEIDGAKYDIVYCVACEKELSRTEVPPTGDPVIAGDCDHSWCEGECIVCGEVCEHENTIDMYESKYVKEYDSFVAGTTHTCCRCNYQWWTMNECSHEHTTETHMDFTGYIRFTETCDDCGMKISQYELKGSNACDHLGEHHFSEDGKCTVCGYCQHLTTREEVVYGDNFIRVKYYCEVCDELIAVNSLTSSAVCDYLGHHTYEHDGTWACKYCGAGCPHTGERIETVVGYNYAIGATEVNVYCADCGLHVDRIEDTSNISRYCDYVGEHYYGDGDTCVRCGQLKEEAIVEEESEAEEILALVPEEEATDPLLIEDDAENYFY